MEEEIKSCPFCGGKGELMSEGEEWGTIWVACTLCGAESGFIDIHDGKTEKDAIDQWNMRA